MHIRIHNDGKEKDLSFEASIGDLFLETCFGETQEEAIDNLKTIVEKHIKELQNLDYENVRKIDGLGREIIK